VLAEATVMDVNRQAWTGTTSLLVHPASVYIGLRTERYFVNQGQPLKVYFIVTDLDGNPVVDRPVEIRAARLEWKYSGGQWKEEVADEQLCQAGSQREPGSCTFDTPLGGTYRITAAVSDEQGRVNQSQLTRWVSGGKQPPPAMSSRKN
jgi:alpha-2-macroglobulin